MAMTQSPLPPQDTHPTAAGYALGGHAAGSPEGLGGTLNFLLTNRIPRRALTRLVGWISHTRQWPIPHLAIAAWRLFAKLDLSDAEDSRFDSLHACFTRRLKPGARPFDQRATAVCSPCDAIVVAWGRIQRGEMIQAKGQLYDLGDLLLDPSAAKAFEGGTYCTLRLTSSMYHRFHAPHRWHIREVRHVAGDVWNVNPPALLRVPRLYCRNERAVITGHLSDSGLQLALVPVAAVLVAGIRLHFLPTDLRTSGGRPVACDQSTEKAEELGYFEHGSTIVLLIEAGATPTAAMACGHTVRAGQALLNVPATAERTFTRNT